MRLRGGANAEEIAAVLAAIAGRRGPVAETGYERWRRIRLQSLRHGASTG